MRRSKVLVHTLRLHLFTYSEARYGNKSEENLKKSKLHEMNIYSGDIYIYIRSRMRLLCKLVLRRGRRNL